MRSERSAWCGPAILLLSLVSLFAATALLAPTPAFAHGGQIIPPPEPPEPPPPEPPDTPHIPRNEPPPPGPVTPSGGGSTPPSTPRTPGAGRRGPSAPVTPWSQTWRAWWDLHRWSFFPERLLRADSGTVTTPRAGDPEIDPRAAWRAAQGKVADTQILPALRALLGKKETLHGELRSASVLALGKLARKPADVALILEHAENDKYTTLTRESAALAMGLLRRVPATACFTAEDLDAWRARLKTLASNEATPDRTRAFAILSLGLLADQPYATAFSRDGRMVTRWLWQQLEVKHSRPDIPVSILTALGMHPSAGCPSSLRRVLEGVVVQGRGLGRAWTDMERAHALAALARHERGARAAGPQSPEPGMTRIEGLLLRLIDSRRTPKDVRRSAWIQLAAGAQGLPRADRLQALTAVHKSMTRARDPMSEGLANMAIARLVAAHVAEGHGYAPIARSLGHLARVANSGSAEARAWGALALGIASRRVPGEDRDIQKWVAQTHKQLDAMVRKAKGGDDVQAATVTGLAIAEVRAAHDALEEIVEDRGRGPKVRSSSVLGLGLFGRARPEVLRAVRVALWDPTDPDLRSHAAMALSMLGQGRSEAAALVRELEGAKTERVSAHIAIALGRLGSLEAAPTLLELARDTSRSSIARAMAFAALGILADPAPKPSLYLLADGLPHGSLPDALLEALSIL